MQLKFQENVKIWAEKMYTGIQLHALNTLHADADADADAATRGLFSLDF